MTQNKYKIVSLNKNGDFTSLMAVKNYLRTHLATGKPKTKKELKVLLDALNSFNIAVEKGIIYSNIDPGRKKTIQSWSPKYMTDMTIEEFRKLSYQDIQALSKEQILAIPDRLFKLRTIEQDRAFSKNRIVLTPKFVAKKSKTLEYDRYIYVCEGKKIFYHEVQKDKACSAHSFNALLGKAILDYRHANGNAILYEKKLDYKLKTVANLSRADYADLIKYNKVNKFLLSLPHGVMNPGERPHYDGHWAACIVDKSDSDYCWVINSSDNTQHRRLIKTIDPGCVFHFLHEKKKKIDLTKYYKKMSLEKIWGMYGTRKINTKDMQTVVWAFHRKYSNKEIDEKKLVEILKSKRAFEGARRYVKDILLKRTEFSKEFLKVINEVFEDIVINEGNGLTLKFYKPRYEYTPQIMLGKLKNTIKLFLVQKIGEKYLTRVFETINDDINSEYYERSQGDTILSKDLFNKNKKLFGMFKLVFKDAKETEDTFIL